MAWLASDTRQTNRHPKKPNQPRAETARAHPLVDPGNPANSAKTQATTHRPRFCHCMVAMATCSPDRRSKGAHQTKITTVVLMSTAKAATKRTVLTDKVDAATPMRPTSLGIDDQLLQRAAARVKTDHRVA